MNFLTQRISLKLFPLAASILFCFPGCENPSLDEVPFVGPLRENENMVRIEEGSGKVFAESSFFQVSAEDIQAYGHVWDVQPAPTVSGPDKTAFFLENTLPTSYTSQLIRLDGNQQYFVRPYFITLEGETVYGPEESFTTPFESFIDMILVEGGSKVLGSLDSEASFTSSDERPAEEITISTFQIGRYEVSQEFYLAVMGVNPSYNRNRRPNEDCFKCPVEYVTWFDAVEFCTKLSEMTGRSFRLPTEAEWEFAARGGIEQTRRTFYSGSDTLGVVGWYRGNSGVGGFGTQTREVGLLRPNALGIYDMTGNVIEWCSDWFDVEYYKFRPSVNPSGPDEGRPITLSNTGETVISRVSRSCSFDEVDDDRRFCRVANRNPNHVPDRRDVRVGFRIAETIN